MSAVAAKAGARLSSRVISKQVRPRRPSPQSRDFLPRHVDNPQSSTDTATPLPGSRSQPHRPRRCQAPKELSHRQGDAGDHRARGQDLRGRVRRPRQHPRRGHRRRHREPQLRLQDGRVHDVPVAGDRRQGGPGGEHVERRRRGEGVRAALLRGPAGGGRRHQDGHGGGAPRRAALRLGRIAQRGLCKIEILFDSYGHFR